MLFQRLDQEQDFGGHRVVQIRLIGKSTIAAAGDDGPPDYSDDPNYRESVAAQQPSELKPPSVHAAADEHGTSPNIAVTAIPSMRGA